MNSTFETGVVNSAAWINSKVGKSEIAVACVLLGILAILAGARSAHYLLFHTMAEIFAIVVSLSIFMLTWTSHRFLANGYLIVLGGAYGAIGLVDVFHTLTFRGMNLFPEVSPNYPTQFWLIARYLEAIALLWAPLAIDKKPGFTAVSTGFAALAALASAAVVYQLFPATFVDGAGLAPFKIYSEYVIIAMLIVGFVLLYRFRRQFDSRIFILLAGSLWLAVATEFCFTRYAGFYDFTNELGHYFRFLSVALAFMAVVRSGVRQPLELIFREMETNKRMLEEMNGKLIESEGRISAVFQASPIGIVVSSAADGKILELNDATLRLYGFTRDEVMGRTVAELGMYVDLAQRAQMMRQLQERGSIDGFAIDYRKKDGSVGVLEVSGRVIALAGEQCLLAMIVDVTERKQSEQQLREAQKLEALGTLAGGVAHDFNNALATIIGNVELARRDIGQGHAAQVSLDEIGKASRRAKDLVQQILTFGRRQTMERKPTSLALVVLETARLLRATLPTGVSLTVDCSTDVPAVLADPTQIKQILLNLHANALHAVENQARPGVIEIRLTAQSEDSAKYAGPEQRSKGERKPLPDGRYACLSVSDNGSGMDDATRLRVFEPFFTTKPMGKGPGLGLSVVHGIAKAHDATVEVESASGAGSTFRIYFPALDAPVADAGMPAQRNAPVHGKGKHVLYVDDEEAIIFLMKRLLERQGFSVSGYTDPRAAIAAVRADPNQFDLVVTDYNMPHLSGLEVAIALREIRADLPVVLASGYITEELRQKAPAAGVRELIYKPNTVDDLCEAIVRYAGAQSGQ